MSLSHGNAVFLHGFLNRCKARCKFLVAEIKVIWFFAFLKLADRQLVIDIVVKSVKATLFDKAKGFLSAFIAVEQFIIPVTGLNT